MSCHRSPPYLFRGHYPSWASVAKLIKVPESAMTKLRKNRNGVEVISKVVFEERLQQLQERGDCLTFTKVYGLLVYGIILFPHIEHYMDLATIDAFLGKKNGKGLRCCTLLLFLWLTAHLFHSSKKMKRLIDDHYWSCVKPLTKA
ncbi:hypothetical protein CR513_25588, partial [Mucuna pruriens]